ncbi:hypothetical protein Ddc_10168 [Ditylenchus destructor]|nr:hypothetical protein Ddc_10168 [Ditylenchus destructor]
MSTSFYIPETPNKQASISYSRCRPIVHCIGNAEGDPCQIKLKADLPTQELSTLEDPSAGQEQWTTAMAIKSQHRPFGLEGYVPPFGCRDSLCGS